MKKIITYSTLYLIASIAFTSCTSNLAITQRHYNKGLYIDYSSNKETAFRTKAKSLQPKLQTTISAGQTQAEQNARPISTVTLPKVQNAVTIKSIEITKHAIVLQPTVKPLSSNAVENIEVPATKMKPYVSGISNVTDGDDHHRRDTLSFFWLVILVILILWLILFVVGGLGGFIDLLLLVAAVLLVLWLLRII
ncbi:MAG TPA: hypothetical protein VNZ45_08310 [Bacteroidia bacterium]|jgi:hypothetical protein|nr:hypothetical protein [Bacteroidia bacterium]